MTDYVTVTPTSDGALTANVECLQAFGEQVKVTCTSRQNTKASASSMVDYARHITSGTMNYLGDKTGNVNITSAGSEFTYNASGTFEDNHINAESVFMPTKIITMPINITIMAVLRFAMAISTVGMNIKGLPTTAPY